MSGEFYTSKYIASTPSIASFGGAPASVPSFSNLDMRASPASVPSFSNLDVRAYGVSSASTPSIASFGAPPASVPSFSNLDVRAYGESSASTPSFNSIDYRRSTSTSLERGGEVRTTSIDLSVPPVSAGAPVVLPIPRPMSPRATTRTSPIPTTEVAYITSWYDNRVGREVFGLAFTTQEDAIRYAHKHGVRVMQR